MKSHKTPTPLQRPMKDVAHDRKIRAEMEAQSQATVGKPPEYADTETAALLDKLAAQSQQQNSATDAEALTPSEIEYVRQDKKALTKWLATKGIKVKTV